MSIAEYPRAVEKLHKIWSPGDMQRLVERAADIPISELDQLAKRIFAIDPVTPPLPAAYIAVQSAFAIAEQIQCTPGELFRMMREPWPDLVAEKLAEWPAPIVCPVVIP